jgi:hypothetical protein
MIDLKIESDLENGKYLQSLGKAIEDEINRTMKELTVELNEEIRQTLSSQGVSCDGKPMPSEPFRAPHMQSGNLRSSIKARFLQGSERQAVIEAGDLSGKALYAKLLEYGSEKMLPRPFLAPLARKYMQILKHKITNILKGLRS